MTTVPDLLGRARSARAEGAGLERIAELVLDGIGHRGGPLPLEAVCAALGVDLAAADIEGAAGMLLSGGGLPRPLVVVRGTDHARRRRFTAAHELAHLLLGHVERPPTVDGPEEGQADRLAALLLAPPSGVKDFLGTRPPDVRDVERLARAFHLSVEAAARAYAEHHPEPVAVVIVKEGKVERSYRDRARFPFVAVAVGEPAPEASETRRVSEPSDADHRPLRSPHAWWVRPGASPRGSVVEQVRRWRSGASLVLLHLDPPAPT